MPRATNLTSTEQAFLNRMVPHYVAGRTRAEASRAAMMEEVRLICDLFANETTSPERNASNDLVLS